ncbi:MAG TPA: polysaccharide biosynthesis/export family protein [Panacibacter sp.]|nr:polysaccharide biosynthesis/export family protein [Panacibacter sp.]
MKSVSFGLFNCFVLSIVFFTSSCISSKSITYFNNLPDSALVKLEQLQAPQPLIQVNDKLQINIGGESEKTVEYINRHFTGDAAGGGVQAIVDLDGNIELPQIGKLKVAGLSKEAVKVLITNAYKEFLVNPVVVIKFGEFRYSMLGEVTIQGTKTINAEKVNILEAIAQGGGLSQYAEFDNVKIIREVNGNREIVSVNLNDKNILNSPDYYLHTNDIIYVTPKNIKQVTNNFQRNLLYITSIAGVLSILLVLFKN